MYSFKIIVKLTEKPREFKDKISPSDLIKALQLLGEKPTKSEVDLMIWVISFSNHKKCIGN